MGQIVAPAAGLGLNWIMAQVAPGLAPSVINAFSSDGNVIAASAVIARASVGNYTLTWNKGLFPTGNFLVLASSGWGPIPTQAASFISPAEVLGGGTHNSMQYQIQIAGALSDSANFFTTWILGN